MHKSSAESTVFVIWNIKVEEFLKLVQHVLHMDYNRFKGKYYRTCNLPTQQSWIRITEALYLTNPKTLNAHNIKFINVTKKMKNLKKFIS